MIHGVEPGMKRSFDIEKIGDEARDRIDGTVELQFDPIGMTVHPVTAMRLWNIWKLMRGFEAKGLNDLHFTEFRRIYAFAG